MRTFRVAVRLLSAPQLWPWAAIAALMLNSSWAFAANPSGREQARSDESISSTYGSGHFGRWVVDQFGLPAYDYQGESAAEPQEDRSSPHTSQIGNDNITGFAFDKGYVQLYSQGRLMQWVNAYEPKKRQFGGGYGYLRIGNRVISTLSGDDSADMSAKRTFGVGYFRKHLKLEGVEVTDITYAPFGDDPVLLHDVTIRNRSNRPLDATWFEYWGVNPAVPASKGYRGLEKAEWNGGEQILSVKQKPGPDHEWAAETAVVDSNPYTVFAAPLGTEITGFESSAGRFFGTGSRKRPAEVIAGRLSGTLAPAFAQGAASDDMLGFSSSIRLAPGKSITLRFIYGFAAARYIPLVVSKYRKEAAPFQLSGSSWRAALPRVALGKDYRWVAREIAWTAYLVRSASVYEERCGYHTITQGGYYQYALGYNWGTRSWTHYILPAIYLDPELAREILRYTAHLQPLGDRNLLPYGTASLCVRSKLATIGTPTDSDAWLLFAAVSYAFATRDFHFLREKVAFYDSSKRATIWEHLKLAFKHQQSLLGPHGGYLATPDGGTDWSDGLSTAAHQNESLLVTAQVAYVYPLLQALADKVGDEQFGSEVRTAAANARRTMELSWVQKGWYARGYAGEKRIGDGLLFEEPQPWAILAGIPSKSQVQQLLGNIRRFLTGVGAPASLHGPSKIGSAQVPARADPQVSERCPSYDFSAATKDFYTAAPSACWIGGNWFDLNGNLVWALLSLDGEVPNAADYAWGEYLRNSLAVHAASFPDNWDGIVSVDDVCTSYYDLKNQGICGLRLERDAWDGEITEQPTWMVMGLINLAGLRASESGYVVDPQLPVRYFNIRFPTAGVARTRQGLSGYFNAEANGTVTMRVRITEKVPRAPVIRVNGAVVRGTVTGQWVRFAVTLSKGKVTRWEVKKT